MTHNEDRSRRPYGWRPAGPLVGLIGYARAGKDSVAAELVAHYGYRRIAFADPLREAAYALNPIIAWIGYDYSSGIRLANVVDAIGWERAKVEYPEIRRTLQHIGQGLRTTLDPDIWLDHGMRQADKHQGPVVITDVRYPNEAHAIRQRGGVLVRILRADTGPVNGHDSETALDREPVDFIIRNNAGLPELRENAHAVHQAITL